MKKIILLFAILLLLPFSLHAGQNNKLCAANWCFGYGAWMDFSTGVPVSKDGCKIHTWEGSASMSDINGNLLFYTDGNIVYNKNHQVMANGTGLLGDNSSTQSAIIFPTPGNDPNKYYIATVPAEGAGNGFNYSIVDMSQNSGFGQVTQKNIQLSPKVCEKVTAIGHADGENYWLVTQVWGKNEIQVFLVNTAGITLKETCYTNIFSAYSNKDQTKGCIKFSADGTKLASANNGVGVFLYDFNTATGKLTNERSWQNDEFSNAYGVEFSISNRFLYVSASGMGRNRETDTRGYLFQLDLEAGSAEDIMQSSYILENVENTSDGGAMGTLQIAPDSKIYFARKESSGGVESAYLGVINDPEQKGNACNYDRNGFYLVYGSAVIGLPQSIQSFFNIKPGTVDFDDCEGGTIVLDAEAKAGYSYNWTGPQSLNINAAHHEINPTTRANSGTYRLTVTAPDGTKKTFDYKVEIKYVDLGIKLINVTSETGIKSNNQYFSIKNKTPFDVVIANAYLKKGDKFKLNTVSLPVTISANTSSTTDISCYLFSDETGDFNDSLIVEVSEPCEDRIATYMKGRVNKYEPLIVYVHLPDTTSEVGAMIRMPLKARLNKLLPTGTTLDLQITWHYLAKGYSPMYYQNFEKKIIYDKDIDLHNEYITGYFKKITLDTVYNKIADVSGYALLCDMPKVALIFDTDSTHSSVSIQHCIIIGENGSIAITKPACISSDIRMNPDITHAVIPATMPISNDATIKLYSPDADELKLTVYSINGQIVEQFSYINGDVPLYKEIILDLNKYTNGVYCLAWQSKQRTFNKTVVIEK